MREFKFRAWDKKNKRMVIDPLYRCDSRELLKGESIYVDWILMQFTGFKDKNGKDVFEGDVICYNKVFFTVVWSTDGMWTSTSPNPAYDDCYIYTFADVSEVVGDIYSTPELLTKLKKQ